MDKPPREAVVAAFEHLMLLGAIENSDSNNLTAMGRKMAKFPLDPRFSKIILSAPPVRMSGRSVNRRSVIE
ncbi:hypothetical protein NQ317_007272 [Molorchus minor]|uniref:Helicase associated domain-containing protein n=1 Tax=Molorchus minor TaxID=1323400 RepID=A0ABQ9JJC9_9CUCU|nr:hypothetical protein NQ317_007272 [Molorchus minor]